MSFSMDGIVSIWVGRKLVEPGSDFLRDKYRVEYYDPDDQECIVETSPSALDALVSRLSYSESFRNEVVEEAKRVGLTSALWVMAQYDFAYDPVKAGLSATPDEPSYLGSFKWHE
jgi:hypothetical protein